MINPTTVPWVSRSRPPAEDRTRPVEVRVCPRHGEHEFGNYSRGNGRYGWRCKRCVAEAVTRHHQKVKRILVAEHGGRCAVCGYDRCIVSLQFHHVDPTTKAFRVSVASGKSLAAFREEAAKCVLVCANCHGEIEAGMTPSPPAGSWFDDAGRTAAPVERRQQVPKPADADRRQLGLPDL